MNKRMSNILFITLVVIFTAVIVLSWNRPETDTTNANTFTVTLSVLCDSLLGNMDLLDNDKHELVPEDGIIFPETAVTGYEGDSAFDVLQREMRNAGIHMAFSTIPVYNLAFVTGINNLFEFDAGPMSGWLYTVNGQDTGIGASQYILQPGDVIKWQFTLDFSEGWD